MSNQGNWYIVSHDGEAVGGFAPGTYEKGDRIVSTGSAWQALPPPPYALPGAGEVTRAMLETALKTLIPEEGDVPDYAHVWRLLGQEFVGGVKTTGEWTLDYLIAKILTLPAETHTAEDGALLKLWRDGDGNALGAIDEEGRWYLPHLRTLSESHDTGSGSELKVWGDKDGHALLWIDAEGKVHIPHLVAPGFDTENTATAEDVSKLQLQAQAQLSILSKVRASDTETPESRERNRVVVLSEPGDWIKNATHSARRKALFVLKDDDSGDFFIEESATPYAGGYYSRLHPVCASLGVGATEAVIGSRLGLNQDSTTLVRNRHRWAHRRLRERWKWECINHTLNHDSLGAWLVEDFAEAVALGMNTENTLIALAGSDFRNYRWNAGSSSWTPLFNYHLRNYDGENDWQAVSNLRSEPYLYDKTTFGGTPVRVGDNPAWDIHREIRFNQLRMEEIGLGPVKIGTSWASTFSKRIYEFYRRTHRACVGGANHRAPGSGARNTISPLASLVPTFGIDTVGDLASWKADVDDCIERGGLMVFLTHAGNNVWTNNNESETEYPEAWKVPVSQPLDTDGDWDLPRAETGIAHWRDWYPCPNTRLHDLWMLIQYIKEQGADVVTHSQAVDRLGNLAEVGYCTHRNAATGSGEYEGANHDHYFVGIDGSETYQKIED